MKYTDKIYGNVETDDAVIVEIIKSSDFQRLKGVDQAGYSEIYFPGIKHSRFEHSVGCYILLKKFGASIEEQLFGLIHDISHSAFSHTADYIFNSGRGADQNYQDDIFEDFVKHTDIPQILEKYGYDVEYILEESNFPLQENDLPDLCADRIDYSMRGSVVYNLAPKEKIDYFLKHLNVIDNKWIFDNEKSAVDYANLFKKLNDIYYSNKETAAMFSRTSKWIKYAAQKGYIKYEELFATDEEVVEQINKNLSSDEELQVLWKKMNNAHVDMYKKEVAGCEKVVIKSRVVDPLFVNKEGKIERISDSNETWRSILKQDKKPKVHFLIR